MGLAERRALKDFQENRFPALKQQIDQAAGIEVQIDVRWDTLVAENESNLFNEGWTKVYFEPLIAALKSVCRDDLGKEAVQDNLKQIVIQNVSGEYYGSRWANFHDGVLTLDHLPTTNIDSVSERTDGLVQVLEKAL